MPPRWTNDLFPLATSIAHLQERFGATLPYLNETLVDRG
jgi:hypothetical protein